MAKVSENLTIKEIKSTEKQMIDDIVEIHLATFKGFFLTFMGRGFLRQMYRSYCEHTESTLLCASNSEGMLVGFVAYSENMSGLYKHMIKKHLIPFAWYSLGAFLRKPKIFMRLLRAFLKPGESERSEHYVELSSIGVSPDVKSKGVGTRLVDEVKRRVDFSKCAYIALETDALDNEGANRFYVKNGFELIREYETREGRKMNEYRYKKEDGFERKENSLHTEYCEKNQ